MLFTFQLKTGLADLNHPGKHPIIHTRVQRSEASKHLIQRVLSFGLLMLSLVLTACGGGTSSSPNPAASDGGLVESNSDVYISLTDAEGDFLSYTVDVKQITLVKANGMLIDLLPESTRVDFAQYVELSELLTIVSAPPGRYDAATFTLDFSNAVITVQDENGTALLAEPVDDEGAPLAEKTVDIQFGDRDGFVLLAGRPAHISLDFDLDASNTVLINGTDASVTVNPELLVDTVLEDLKTFRLRGLLGSVSPDRNTFEINLRPFRIRDRGFGRINARVTSETVYEINGELVLAENGLRELAALAPSSPVIAKGNWNRMDHSFTAEEVYAGSSVPWGEADGLRGTVVAREGNSLSLKGATVEFSDGRFTFNDTVTLLVSDTTRVVQARDPQASIANISIGSAIFASGELVDDSTLDARSGIVRIVPGNVTGTVVSASPLAVNLSLINGRSAVMYDFNGSGISEDNDADPAFYEVASGELSLSNIELGDPVRVKGFTADFGFAPEDFLALSVRNASNVSGHMFIGYSLEGVATAITSLDENGILFDTSEAGTRHHMVFAGIPVDLNSVQAGIPLVVPASELGVYAISLGERIIVSRSYNRFVELLSEQLEAGRKVVRFDAQGYYVSTDNAFTSRRLRVRLTE